MAEVKSLSIRSVELLDMANRLDDIRILWALSEAADLHLSNASYLIRRAVEAEEDRRNFK